MSMTLQFTLIFTKKNFDINEHCHKIINMLAHKISTLKYSILSNKIRY